MPITCFTHHSSSCHLVAEHTTRLGTCTVETTGPPRWTSSPFPSWRPCCTLQAIHKARRSRWCWAGAGSWVELQPLLATPSVYLFAHENWENQTSRDILGDDFMQQSWFLLAVLWNCTCVGLKSIKHLISISCSDLSFASALPLLHPEQELLAAQETWQTEALPRRPQKLQLPAEYSVQYSPHPKRAELLKYKMTTCITSKPRKVWRWVESGIFCHNCQGETGTAGGVLVSYQLHLAPVPPSAPTGSWHTNEGDTWAQ